MSPKRKKKGKKEKKGKKGRIMKATQTREKERIVRSEVTAKKIGGLYNKIPSKRRKNSTRLFGSMKGVIPFGKISENERDEKELKQGPRSSTLAQRIQANVANRGTSNSLANKIRRRLSSGFKIVEGSSREGEGYGDSSEVFSEDKVEEFILQGPKRGGGFYR